MRRKSLHQYEIMIIYDTEHETVDILKKFTEETFSASKIKITESADMGQRDLSFAINDKTRGNYYLFNVETEPNNLKEIEQPFKLKKGILRYLVIRK
jgi:ribosomal protein S6